MRKHSTLERQMLTYFGLIAVASMLITAEFVWALNVIRAKTEPAIARSEDSAIVLDSLVSLQNKSLLMGIIMAVVTLIVLIMFTRRISTPLQQMVDQSRLIADGDLSLTIQIHRHDEIGLLGETINGLTSNIQEIVAFGLSTESAARCALKDLRSQLKLEPGAREPLEKLGSHLDGMRELLESFQLLPAPKAASGRDGCTP